MRKVKIIVAIILMSFFGFSSVEIMGQSRKNFIGLTGDLIGSVSTGLSYERSVGNKVSLSISLSGIIPATGGSGFIANLEPRYYFKKKSDSTSRCKGWYLGVKPSYKYQIYRLQELNAPNTPTSSTISSTILYITFGRQWVFKSGIFLNANLGVGPGFNFNDSSAINPFQFYLINIDLGVKVGYSF